MQELWKTITTAKSLVAFTYNSILTRLLALLHNIITCDALLYFKSNRLYQMIYLVIAEILKNGYVLKATNNEIEANIFYNQILKLSQLFPFGQSEKIAPLLKNAIHYVISGNNYFISNSITTVSNGEFFLYVLKIEQNNFCLKKLIRERENHSTVFQLEELAGKYSEHFIGSNLIAN